MKRTTIALTAIALALTSAHGAFAATKKKPAPAPKPTPVTTTYYFHSPSQIGNQDSNQVSGTYLSMDATAPSGTTDHHFGFFGGGATPNNECAGSTVFPNFIGKANGSLTGTMKVTFFAESTPGASTVVQVFADVAGLLCNGTTQDFPTPIGQATVALPVQPGMVTVSIPVEGKGIVSSSFDVQFNDSSAAAPLVGPQLSDVIFDSKASPSSITWTCLPNRGKKTC